MEKSSTFTRLSGKEYSPLILRRYSSPVLHWVCIITDENLDDLDNWVRAVWEGQGDDLSIQQFRNLAGQMTGYLSKEMPHAEGIAVVIAADKMLISSLFGDFMNHSQCRLELFSLLQLSTQV